MITKTSRPYPKKKLPFKLKSTSRQRIRKRPQTTRYTQPSRSIKITSLLSSTGLPKLLSDSFYDRIQSYGSIYPQTYLTSVFVKLTLYSKSACLVALTLGTTTKQVTVLPNIPTKCFVLHLFPKLAKVTQISFSSTPTSLVSDRTVDSFLCLSSFTFKLAKGTPNLDFSSCKRLTSLKS